MSTRADRAVKIARDILAMLTGSAGMLFMLRSETVNIVGVIACLVLLGVPLVNLRALMPGTEDTQSSSRASQRSSSRDGQRRQSLPGGDDDD